MRAPLLDGSRDSRSENAFSTLDATLDTRVPSASAPERGARELLRLTRDSRSRTLRAFWKRHVVYALFQKGGVELERLPFARDAVATLTLTIVLVSVYGNGATTEPKAWTLIGLYAAYVCVVVLPGWVKALRHGHEGGAIDHGWETRSVATSFTRNAGARRFRGVGADGEAFDEPFDDAYAALVGDPSGEEGGSLGSLGLVTELPSSREEEEEKRLGLGPRNGAPGMRWGGGGAGSASSARDARDDERRRDADGGSVDDDADDADPMSQRLTQRRTVPFQFRRLSRTCARLFLVALEAPFLFAMRVTMPDLAGDPARRSRLLAAATPMTAPAFLVLATRAFPNGGLDENAMVYGLGVGALGSIAVWCAWPALVRGEHAGLSKTSVAVMDAALTVTAYVVSATWMYAASGELESLVRAAAADALGDEYWDSTDEVRSTSSSSSFPLKSKLASVATFHVLVSWCKYGGALFSTVACARVGKPAAAAAACFSMSVFLLSVGVAAPALVAFRFGDLEESNFGLVSGNDNDSRHATLFSNEVVVSTAFTIVAATYMTFAVPWAHEWRVGRAGACGFLGAYFVFALFRGCVETGILFRHPWFEKEGR